MRTAVRIVDRADGLNLVAHTDALTAEDALACIAGDAYGRIVNIGLCGVGETNGANIVTLCKLLKFAVSVLFAGVAVAAMVCKQQLDDILAILAEPFGVCINLHAGTGLCGTCSIKTAALVFKHAHTACAVDGQLGVVAKCGHVDARLADNFKDVLLAVKLNGDVVNIHKFLFHCLFLPDCVERAGGDTCAAAETLCKVNMERALKLAADRACGALPCALGAAFADCGIDHDSLQPCAVAGGAAFFENMRFVFVAEVFNRADDGVGCGFSETAKSGGRYGVRKFEQQLDVAFFALAVNDALKDLKHTLGAFAAGGALAAGFVLGEVHEEACNFDHAGFVVHDDKTAGTYHCADFLEGVEIKGQVKIFFGQTAAGRAADLNGFKLTFAAHTAADSIDDFAQSGAHGDFDKTGVCNIAGDCERLRAGAGFGTDGAEHFAPLEMMEGTFA